MWTGVVHNTHGKPKKLVEAVFLHSPSTIFR